MWCKARPNYPALWPIGVFLISVLVFVVRLGTGCVWSSFAGYKPYQILKMNSTFFYEHLENVIMTLLACLDCGSWKVL